MNSVFDIQDIEVEEGDSSLSVRQCLERGEEGRTALVQSVRNLLTLLNDGMDFGVETAEIWARYLGLLIRGRAPDLSDPYSDLKHYRYEPVTKALAQDTPFPALRFLNDLPDRPMAPSRSETKLVLNQTLLILAVGGADSTFYSGLSSDETNALEKCLFSDAVRECFPKRDGFGRGIPRAFASKTSRRDETATILGSMALQAYNAGIRNAALICNSKTFQPIQNYIRKEFDSLKDMRWIFPVQPLFPVIRLDSGAKTGRVTIKNGAYPGGHGHGFQISILHESVQRNVQTGVLKHFIFANGDNLALLNWGGNHLARMIVETEREKSGVRTALLLVWETFRKGGFAYKLTRPETGASHGQIIEAELAGASRISLKETETNQVGYNTNSAFGQIRAVQKHLGVLPMALKLKRAEGIDGYVLESSISSVLGLRQDKDGVSSFEPGAMLYFLPPEWAVFPHWSHISIRKRGDLFTFLTSLFRVRTLNTPCGNFPVIVTERTAAVNHPVLEGNVLNPGVLDTKAFIEIFRSAEIDADDFTGVLKIDLLEEKCRPRGRIRFRGNIRLIGSGTVSITVPAGETWTIENRTIQSPAVVMAGN